MYISIWSCCGAVVLRIGVAIGNMTLSYLQLQAESQSICSLAWWTDCLSADVAVHAHTRMWLERLLSGAGLPAWAALHSVSLSPPQPAMAGPVHGEWYRPSHIGISIHSSFSIAHVNIFLCLCWAFIWSSVCAGYQLRASIYSYGPADSQPSPFALDTSIRSAEALSGKKNTFMWLFFSARSEIRRRGWLLVKVTPSTEH